MDTNERHNKVLELKTKLTTLEEEVRHKCIEKMHLKKEIFEAEWIEFTWDELRDWLKANRPENDYQKNPMVSNGFHATSYCFLTDSGELQIGSWFHNDQFRRGCPLFVHYQFKSWR